MTDQASVGRIGWRELGSWRGVRRPSASGTTVRAPGVTSGGLPRAAMATTVTPGARRTGHRSNGRAKTKSRSHLQEDGSAGRW